MKGNLKRAHIINNEAGAPVDSIEVLDRRDFEDLREELHRDMWNAHRDHTEYADRRISELENKIKTMSIVGSVVGAALCFVMFMRKDD
jgi:hypothetical protein